MAHFSERIEMGEGTVEHLPDLPHAPDRLVVGGGHLTDAVVVERPHRRVPAVLAEN